MLSTKGNRNWLWRFQVRDDYMVERKSMKNDSKMKFIGSVKIMENMICNNSITDLFFSPEIEASLHSPRDVKS